MNLKPNSILFSPKRAFPKWLWDACLLALLIPVYLGHFPPETVNALRPLILATSLCAYGILALKIYVWDNHTLRELLGISLILLLVGLGTVFSGNRCFLSCFLLVFSAKDQDYDKLCRFFFWFFFATLLLNLLLVGAGVLEDTLSTRWEAINFGATRHSYGFGHPNTFGFWTLLLIFSGLLYIPRKGHRALSCLISVLLAFCVFRVTDSKAALLSSLAAIVLCLIAFRIGPWLSSKKWSVPLCLGLYLLGIAAFLSLTLLYQEDNGFYSTCNALLSDRLAYSSAAFRSFGVKLFGAQVHFRWDPVDSLYAYAPICMGLIPTVLYFGLNLISLYRAARAGRWDIVAVAFAGALYSTMEYGLMNPVHLPIFAACARLEVEKGRKSSV